MEQNNLCNSPYRCKNILKNEKPKFLKKFTKQLLSCIVIFLVVLISNNVNIIKTSNLWQSIISIFYYDMNISETYQTFSNAMAYIKEKIPEFNEHEEIQSEIDEKIQMQIDVEDIRNKMKVLRPVAGEATLRFGKRENSDGIEELHTGVDLKAEIGTPIKAAISGKVIEVKELEDSFGKFIRIQNEDIITTYAHCSSIEVNIDDEVEQGEIIAYSGNTGNSTGPHLHFEITKNGRYVDPGFLLTYE